MITSNNKGVNFCTCMMCSTSFFFDKEDVLRDEKISKFPFVVCPYCKHEMKLGWNKEYFKYIERK